MKLGYIENGHCRDVLQSFSEDIFRLAPVVAITSIDSMTSDRLFNSTTVQSLLASTLIHCEWRPDALLMSTREILEADRHYNLLNGFEELHFYAESPPKNLMLPFLSMTSEVPITEFDEVTIKKAITLLEVTNGMLVLGDGCGLNYVVNEAVLKQLSSILR